MTQSVGPAKAILNPLGDLDKQLIAHEVTKAVVDFLEMVDVEKEHRELVIAVDPGALDAAIQPVQQQITVAQAGQLVVERRVTQLFLSLPADGDFPLEVGLLALELGRPLPDLALEGLHKGPEHMGERLELRRAALLDRWQLLVALHGLDGDIGELLHRSDQAPRRPLAHPLDDRQVDHAHDADD